MAESQRDLVEWALTRAEEYLLSAKANVEADRLYTAAEEIFRAVETSLEALLYYHGVRRIEYPGRKEKFTGRLALQFLVRDNLVAAGRLSKADYNHYLKLAADLHQAGYRFGRFSEQVVEDSLSYAEDLFYRVKAATQK